MAITYAKFFAPAVLATGAAATRYTVPAAPANVLLRGGQVSLTNTTSAAATPTLYAVPAAGSAGASNAYFNQAIGPFQTVLVNVPLLEAGGTLQDKCDTASAITIQAVSGALFS